MCELFVFNQYQTSSAVCPAIHRRDSRVHSAGFRSASFFLLTYMACATAGLSVVLHLRSHQC